MDYLSVADKIFRWLASFQIQQDKIRASVKDGDVHFSLHHPVRGEESVKLKLTESDFFRYNGIGLKKSGDTKHGVMLDVYDYGGIFDPIDDFVPGDHYATTHFALLGAILYQEQESEQLLEKIKRAIRFHLNTYQDEYYFGDWGYHWDFKNYAFIETYLKVRDKLAPEERKSWEIGIKHWNQNTNNPLTNWLAMRAYANLMRYRTFGNFIDKIKFWNWQRRMEKARQNDGCYDDYRNQSRPIQYHVFTLALIHRIWLLDKSRRLQKHFLEGVKYFSQFIDPDGCFNYLGRGQEQNFGYAVAIYSLEAASQMDIFEKKFYRYMLEKVWEYFVSFQKNDHFPLVLNDRPDEEKFGWYDYHHLTVYNAFVGAWLGLAHQLSPEDGRSNSNAQVDLTSSKLTHFKSTKNVIYRQKEYFVCLSGGCPEYLSEPTITPVHIWFQKVGWLFSCPGGPSPKKYGKRNFVEHIEKNLLAPIFRLEGGTWDIPAYAECSKMEVNGNSVRIGFDYRACRIERVFVFEEDQIKIRDDFKFNSSAGIEELRYFNLPIAIDKFDYSIQGTRIILSKNNKEQIEIQINATSFPDTDFEELEKIKTAKGLVQIISVRALSPDYVENGDGFIEFTIQRMNG